MEAGVPPASTELTKALALNTRSSSIIAAHFRIQAASIPTVFHVAQKSGQQHGNEGVVAPVFIAERCNKMIPKPGTFTLIHSAASQAEAGCHLSHRASSLQALPLRRARTTLGLRIFR